MPPFVQVGARRRQSVHVPDSPRWTIRYSSVLVVGVLNIRLEEPCSQGMKTDCPVCKGIPIMKQCLEGFEPLRIDCPFEGQRLEIALLQLYMNSYVYKAVQHALPGPCNKLQSALVEGLSL